MDLWGEMWADWPVERPEGFAIPGACRLSISGIGALCGNITVGSGTFKLF